MLPAKVWHKSLKTGYTDIEENLKDADSSHEKTDLLTTIYQDISPEFVSVIS